MLTAVENFAPGRPYPTSHHYGAVPNLLAHCPMTPLPTLNSAAAVAMSAAEFARPHPKTTSRYNSNSQSLRGCNGISSPRSKYSTIEQSGPVNLSPHQSSASPSGPAPGRSIQVSFDISAMNTEMSKNGGCPGQTAQASATLSSSPSLSSPDARQQKSPQSAFIDPLTSSNQTQSHPQQQSHSEQDAIQRSLASLYGSKLPFCPTPVSAPAAYQLNFSNMYNRAGVFGYV